MDDDGKGGILRISDGDTSVPASGHMPANGFYFDNIMRSPEFDEETADPEDNAEDCQIISDEDLVYYREESG